MKKTTITVTCFSSYNYGAALQAYAFQNYITELGVDNIFLRVGGVKPIYRKMSLNFGIARGIMSFVYHNSFKLFHSLSLSRKRDKFLNFFCNYLPIQDFRDVESVQCYNFEADIFITGSDQVFNVERTNGINAVNFLTFVNDKRKVSYATSLGIEKVPDEYKSDFGDAIAKYDCLSVREKVSSEYITDTWGIDCENSVDPSLLLTAEQWDVLAKESEISVEDSYILVYAMGFNALYSMINEAITELKSKTGLKVVVISPEDRCHIKADKVIRDAGPCDFVKLFKNAEYVLTSSFHGTCFSIIFNKKFFSFIREKGETRITGLLNLLGLNDRICKSPSQICLDQIDYEHPQQNLDNEILQSKEYLKKALSI